VEVVLMAWSIEGTFFENCSCDAICPCTWSNMAHRATNDYCRAALAFQIDRGDVEGTDLAGRSFVVVLDTPAFMPDGGWRVGAFVDDGASPEQVAALGRVVSGEIGGPLAGLAPLIGEFLGLEQAPIAITSDGRHHHVQVGSVIDYEADQVLTADGDRVELTNIVIHPAGPTLAVTTVTANNSPFGASWSGRDLSGFSNRFSWAA
jgi:hypothetical protein